MSQSSLWLSLEKALHGVHPSGGNVFQVSPEEVSLSPHLTDTWATDASNTNLGIQSGTPSPLEVADELCRALREFVKVRSCRIEIDGMEILDWQALLEAELGQFDQPVFVRVLPRGSF